MKFDALQLNTHYPVTMEGHLPLRPPSLFRSALPLCSSSLLFLSALPLCSSSPRPPAPSPFPSRVLPRRLPRPGPRPPRRSPRTARRSPLAGQDPPSIRDRGRCEPKIRPRSGKEGIANPRSALDRDRGRCEPKIARASATRGGSATVPPGQRVRRQVDGAAMAKGVRDGTAPRAILGGSRRPTAYGGR